ncbi:MAG: phenylpropionate dioxygenase-like ring-hydroxylating dioxygenase large terminal subunit [Candidatus Poriferisodalaceae bacterium]|jgi:phenylpropionate dioxygenase-like ring-hydroxylating dioxygenase large terminal subunit
MATKDELGTARSPGVSYQELLDTDTREVPIVLRLESPKYLGSEDVSVARYTTREWHLQEVEHLWSRVWQYACRTDEIPEVGDHYIYEIVRDSFIVINTEEGIKAYPNACLHRGRRLKDHDGHCSEIRCPFHGFAWTVEGALQDIPAQWDFDHIDADNFGLPEVKVDTWAGFVFINPDPQAEPLAEFLGDIVEHFEVWDLEKRYKQAHVAKVIHANWKITQEAFCEAYHVNATHPQIMPYLGDTNSQIDIWDNFARVITASGTPSPNLSWSPTPDEMMRSMMDVRHDQEPPVTLADDTNMRATAAAGGRARWSTEAGEEWANRMSDAEMMDSIDYTVFPNFHPWGAFNRIVYRFRPNGDDHRSSIMECIFVSPYVGEKPAPAPIHWLTEDETFTDAKELGMLGKVFNQDLFNMQNVQLGLEATRKPGITLSNYQESKVRWLHQLLTEWVEKPAADQANQ